MALVPFPQRTAISCIINFACPSYSGIQARRAEILPILSPLPVVNFIQLSSRKPVTISRTYQPIFLRTLTTRTLPFCSTRTPLSQTLFVTSFKVDSTSKNTWGMVLLIVRALLRRPSLSGSPAVTFCSAHIHNVVAKKRHASTELLQFLHSKMLEYNVDFIGGDFNMSAFSTVSDVFSDPEFSAPGHSCLWGLGALDEQHRECTGFLIMPKRPYEWRVDSHGCYKIDNSALGLGPRDQSAHLPVFLHFRNTDIPGPNGAMRSEQAKQRRLERRPQQRTLAEMKFLFVHFVLHSVSVSVLHAVDSVPMCALVGFMVAKTTTRRRTLL